MSTGDIPGEIGDYPVGPDGMSEKWREHAMALRDIAEMFGIELPRCMPGEPEDCRAGSYAEHAMNYAAAIVGAATVELAHLHHGDPAGERTANRMVAYWTTQFEQSAARRAAHTGDAPQEPELPVGAAFALIRPDGGLEWVELDREAAVDEVVVNSYGAVRNEWLGRAAEPLKVRFNDVGIAKPDLFPPNPHAQRVIAALSAGYRDERWLGTVAVYQHDGDGFPVPMDPAWVARIQELFPTPA